MNKEMMIVFGHGIIATVVVKTLGTLVESDWRHERFESEEEMYETYRSYYGDKVGADSNLKIISFEFYANRED